MENTLRQSDDIITNITDTWDTLYIGLNFHYPTMERAMLTSHIPV